MRLRKWQARRKVKLMFNLNKVLFTGRLTRDAEVRHISNGCIVTLGVAINNRYCDKDGNWHTDTAFVDVKVFGKAADRCQELAKGTGVCVEGSIRQEEWETKEGEKRRKLLFKADSVKVDKDSSTSDEKPLERENTPSRGYSEPPEKDLWGDQAKESDDIPF